MLSLNLEAFWGPVQTFSPHKVVVAELDEDEEQLICDKPHVLLKKKKKEYFSVSNEVLVDKINI